ncbi:MAG: T9SS type A sorting domain-containing protein [Bacteroidetes bacterium]|nr:T9SS type A sorting domain-containing protein [Bacteroidota bacterium]
MKKILFLSATICTAAFTHAQVLQSDNFNSYNVATIIGQGSPAYQKLNGANTDYMVVNSGNASKGFAITGAATAGTSTSRYAWKDGLDTAWAGRTVGNNIIQIEFDFFTGPTSTSNNGGGMEMIDEFENYLGGFTMNQSTKTLYGIYTPNGDTDPTLVNLGTTPIVLPANTWVRLGWAYNSVTGVITLKGPGFNGTVTGNVGDPLELDYAVQNLESTNTANSVSTFDNVMVKAVAVENLLNTSEIQNKEIGFSIYPNPTTDFINIKMKSKYSDVYIYDAAGFRIDAVMVNGKIDVRKLVPGMYMLGVKTESGLVTHKFIKK